MHGIVGVICRDHEKTNDASAPDHERTDVSVYLMCYCLNIIYYSLLMKL